MAVQQQGGSQPEQHGDDGGDERIKDGRCCCPHLGKADPFERKVGEDRLVIIKAGEGRVQNVIQIIQTHFMKADPDAEYCGEKYQAKDDQCCRKDQ